MALSLSPWRRCVLAAVRVGCHLFRTLDLLLQQLELTELESSLDSTEADLKRLLVPRDEADARDCILEFRAGTGGDEAGLFAGECAEPPGNARAGTAPPSPPTPPQASS